MRSTDPSIYFSRKRCLLSFMRVLWCRASTNFHKCSQMFKCKSKECIHLGRGQLSQIFINCLGHYFAKDHWVLGAFPGLFQPRAAATEKLDYYTCSQDKYETHLSLHGVP